LSENPVHHRPRRLVDWLKPTEGKKVHSLVDKVYQRKNLEMAWEQVRANRGSGSVEGEKLAAESGFQCCIGLRPADPNFIEFGSAEVHTKTLPRQSNNQTQCRASRI
jgi:hypothetical protein